MMWGWPFSTWEWVVKASLFLAVATGVATAFFAFVAGYVGYELADAVGKVSDQRVADAQAAAGRANEEAGRANENAGKANERAALADKATEAERLERLKLEAVVAPRSLSLVQQKETGLWLAAFSGKHVAVETYALDADGATLATQIMAALSAASIVVDNRIASRLPIGGFFAGIQVTGKDTNLAASLRTALISIGHLAVAPASAEMPGSAGMVAAPPDGTSLPDASILIGVKPVQTIPH